jgi:uncharacterized protein involved in cysteine biosynthesis
MTAIFPAFARALGQLGDRRVLAVMIKSMGVTLAIFAALAIGLWRGAALAIERYAQGWGELAGLAALLLALIAGWIAFRILALAVLQLFADEVVRAVEARHYPAEAAAARELPFTEDARNALGGVGRALLANALALPVALFLLVTGVGTAAVFWAVNAWLLGRELMDMVWLRHRPSRTAALPLSGLTRFALGGIVAAMLMVPFVNLLAPVVGAAAATHLVHSRRVRS